MNQFVRGVKRQVPWWAKMGVKIAVAQLPVGYEFWRSLSLMAHGPMREPDAALETFVRHYDAGPFVRKGDGFSVLELGPGDSLNTALVAHVHGARETVLIDVGPIASVDWDVCRRMIEYLGQVGFHVADLEPLTTFDSVLAVCGGRYLTRGLESLRSLPDASVDFAFSNAVLQCIPQDQIAETLRELRRVLHPSGMSSHSIDLRDHLTSGLNHLRFSERTWESKWLGRCGFYSSQLRISDWRSLFEEAGFRAEISEVHRWDRLPLPRSRMHPTFRQFPDDELCVGTINATLHPR